MPARRSGIASRGSTESASAASSIRRTRCGVLEIGAVIGSDQIVGEGDEARCLAEHAPETGLDPLRRVASSSGPRMSPYLM